MANEIRHLSLYNLPDFIGSSMVRFSGTLVEQERKVSHKFTFSRSDLMAINRRISRMPGDPGAASALQGESSVHALSRAPSSAIAAKVMREVGVSQQKMSEAYMLAKSTIGSSR